MLCSRSAHLDALDAHEVPRGAGVLLESRDVRAPAVRARCNLELYVLMRPTTIDYSDVLADSIFVFFTPRHARRCWHGNNRWFFCIGIGRRWQ